MSVMTLDHYIFQFCFEKKNLNLNKVTEKVYLNFSCLNTQIAMRPQEIPTQKKKDASRDILDLDHCSLFSIRGNTDKGFMLTMQTEQVLSLYSIIKISTVF